MVVEQISRVVVSGAGGGRGREIVERDVGRPPGAVGVLRNGEGSELLGSSPSPKCGLGEEKQRKDSSCGRTSQGQAAEQWMGLGVGACVQGRARQDRASVRR